jgi:hypothetical protein
VSMRRARIRTFALIYAVVATALWFPIMLGSASATDVLAMVYSLVNVLGEIVRFAVQLMAWGLAGGSLDALPLPQWVNWILLGGCVFAGSLVQGAAYGALFEWMRTLRARRQSRRPAG